jgi:hypothetical protein
MSEFFDDDTELLDDGTYWRTCWQCGGEGVGEHDCFDDTCCCLNPIPNTTCDICRGAGGWKVNEPQ